MKYIKVLILSVLFPLGLLMPQKKDLPLQKENPDGVSSILDRAGGTHNASNIGLFFENRGKLYPRRLSQGPSGEFPLNSGKHYIYRVNPYVGIPGNVIQGRFTTNEEWEAVGGYHNNEGAKVAFSDNPNTWSPVNGWPVKDAQGNPVIKSDQDSYCVYSDSNNTKEVLGITMTQTGYAYGVRFAQNILFFKYQVINNGKKTLNDLYFALYSDIDVGNVSGGVPEYLDDRIGFDKANNFVYFYDDGISTEWPDGKTGYFGVTFLKTPMINGAEAGITDMHYALYDDDDISDIDSVLYGRMASSPSLYNSPLGPKFFHLGNNTGLNYDDVSTIPATGLDILATLSSGPYTLAVGDTLTFYTAFIAGDNLADAYYYLDNAKRILQFDFEISKPPITPKVSGYASDKANVVYWDDAAEKSKDNFTGQYDFEGYRIYRSVDRGVNWTLLSDFDVNNGTGIDKGLQYSFKDTNVFNGFEYWYTVTSYDRGDSLIESLESPLGKTTDAVNLISLTPYSAAAGRTPVSAGTPVQTGTGSSNYNFKIQPVDDAALAGNNYSLGFTFSSRVERGVLATRATAIIQDTAKVKPERYGIYFKSANRFDLVNLTTGENIKENNSYVYTNPNQTYTASAGAVRIQLFTDPATPAEFLPKAGDVLTVDFSVYAIKNATDTVIYPRTVFFDKPQATRDGVIFTVSKPDPVKSVSRIGGLEKVTMTFSAADEAVIVSGLYIVTITGKGTNAAGEGFVSVKVEKDNAQVAVFDTVYTSSAFTFQGVRGRVEFNSANPPGSGNSFSVETLKPVSPTPKDKFAFTINGPVIDLPKAAASISSIKVVPNPYVVSSLYEPEFGELRREPLRQIQFINLPSECTIHIFTLDADLIKTINHSSNSGTATWDLKSEGGREIAPGMYIYVVKSAAGEHLDRFAIIK